MYIVLNVIAAISVGQQTWVIIIANKSIYNHLLNSLSGPIFQVRYYIIYCNIYYKHFIFLDKVKSTY